LVLWRIEHTAHKLINLFIFSIMSLIRFEHTANTLLTLFILSFFNYGFDSVSIIKNTFCKKFADNTFNLSCSIYL